MKLPHLLASFAVAATASAAELKDPAVVAREWNEATTPSFPAPVDHPGLRGSLELMKPIPRSPLPMLSIQPAPTYQVPPWSKPPPRHPGTDIPDADTPAGPDGRMPRGAKPWRYGGQTYWLMPLIPSRD